MKKITTILLGVASAFCLTAGAVTLKNSTYVASADETSTASVVLSETKYKVSDNGENMLLVTAIQNYTNVYEVGYEFSAGYTVGESAKTETTKYYDTITTATTETAEDIFGADYADAKLVIWEVAYEEGITFNAYAMEGVVENGELHSGTKVTGATKTTPVTEDKFLAGRTSLISKISNVSCTKGTAQVGNVTGGIYGGENAKYCIKLPGNNETGYMGARVTFDVEVGDVSGYEKLEITFWAVNNYGSEMTFYAGGAKLFSTVWRGYDAPVTVEVPVSAVKDGKLTIAFEQQYGTGDELYIQSIKAIAPDQA